MAEFASVASRVCALLDAGSPSVADLEEALAELYVGALHLSDLPPEEGAPGPSPVLPPAELILPFDLYWDQFDPHGGREEPVANSLRDDLVDIRADLRRGLDLLARGYPAAACSEWRVSFRAHWGEHLVGALRALFTSHRSG